MTFIDNRVETEQEKSQAEIDRLQRCIREIEDELTRDPPRIGDALWICKAALANEETK